MKLYDDVIMHWDTLISECPNSVLEVKSNNWPDVGNQNMVLRSDMAYELGGSHTSLAALGGTAVTDNRDLVPEDQIILVGPDLPEITSDISYARLAIARVREEEMGEGNTLYNAIRKIEYVRYHVNPEGFMVRVSSIHERESVRISKEAISKGLTFTEVGNCMLEAFHQNSKVEAVKLIFITDPAFDYKALERDIQLSEKITKTIDHMFKNVTMDCGACSLQEVCDEVEGMKELHFGMSASQDK